jgi:hypothetical protein
MFGTQLNKISKHKINEFLRENTTLLDNEVRKLKTRINVITTKYSN